MKLSDEFTKSERRWTVTCQERPEIKLDTGTVH